MTILKAPWHVRAVVQLLDPGGRLGRIPRFWPDGNLQTGLVPNSEGSIGSASLLSLSLPDHRASHGQLDEGSRDV
jgi:hypothetical protein